MLNYANLNDMEFEALCRDVMEQKLGVSLRRFGPGKDGGVDLTDDVAQKEIIVQVKHYRKSDTSALIRSLKGERSKVDKLQPKKYYICCSTELSHSRINELYQHFEPYMDSDDHVITLTEIDDLLHQNGYRDILKRHFKLWLDDVGILEDIFGNELFVDCEVLLDDIEEQQKLFVQTKAFDQALNALENRQILCIVGNPGVGKSITSKMLVLHYAAQGYQVRYTSDVTDLAALKNSISHDPDKKEIILLDDCFGQAYFEMQAKQSTALVQLIKYVKKHHPTKVLILNSRVTIFQEAMERQQELVRCIDRKDFRVHVLDMNNLSQEERAKILYNHLAFSGIPDGYFESIRLDRKYRYIISHRNYNPRIIEFVCNPNHYSKIPPSQFFEYIMKQLDNPQEIWANEYDDHLLPTDRILLQTIYSLTKTNVNADLVRRCFERRISFIPTIDKTLKQYERSLRRLNKGFIRILDNMGTEELSMQNPSVNDFLSSRLCADSLEYTSLLHSICTMHQLHLLSESDRLPYVVDLLQTGVIDSFIFLHRDDRSTLIGHCLLSAGLLLNRYLPEFHDFLANQDGLNCLAWLIPTNIPQLLENLQSPEMWDYYQITEFFLSRNHLYNLLRHLDLENAVHFIDSISDYFTDTEDTSFIQQVECYLDDAIIEFCNIDAEDYVCFLDVLSLIERAVTETCDGTTIDIPKATAAIKEELEENVLDSLRDILNDLPSDFSDYWHIDYSRDITVTGMEDLVRECVAQFVMETTENSEYPVIWHPSIDEMFNR